MVVLGVVFGGVLAALVAVVVTAVTASVLTGSAAWWVGGVTAAGLCLALPMLLDRRLTRAFRRLQPGAGSTFFQTLALVNALWLAVLVLLAPQRTRLGLEQRGARLVPLLSQRHVERIAALIPRSAAPIAIARARGASGRAAAPSPSVGTIIPPEPSAAPVSVPIPVSSGIRPASDVETDSETPAGKVFRERASSVVVIHAHIAVPEDGVMSKLYERLGVSYAESLGSGFVVDSAGLIVTNHHVVEGATSLRVVTQDGSHYEEVSLLRDEPKHDLALLSVSAQGLPAAPVSRAKDVSVGARAIAIGSPLGFEYTLTDGIISQRRNVDGTRFLQMQTAIAPGSSGGPLFDEHGSVIGVNTATGGAPGLSLAVHFSEVLKLLAAPRSPKVLERFVPGPKLASLESEGAELAPTDRMNLREGTSLLGHVAMKCAKPLVEDARVVVKLKGLTGSPSIETNLSDEARNCMDPMLTLIGMQIAFAFANLAQPPRALLLTFVDIPREGGTSGSLNYRFERGEGPLLPGVP
ncbi:MAG TPA: trypsin-like peptidase domain-containing protein [Polyangiaceae bacterium]|nr:trypsin-like peptidase domain-containing protein [Polyangiaceae bacterium]